MIVSIPVFLFMNRFIKYFLQGILFVVPVSITIYVIWACINWIDKLIYKIADACTNIPIHIPGLGVIAFLLIITFLGYVGSTFIASSLFNLIDSILNKLPLVKIIHSSLKDLISAFVGDKKKFNQAVLVTLNRDPQIQKLGFITQKDLSALGLQNKVAVYFPHSYNFSGNLFIVPADTIQLLDLPGSEVMKLIVSGGVAEMGK